MNVRYNRESLTTRLYRLRESPDPTPRATPVRHGLITAPPIYSCGASSSPFIRLLSDDPFLERFVLIPVDTGACLNQDLTIT